MRHVAMVVVAWGAIAHAAPDAEDVQPTSHDVALPDPDLAVPPPPAGVPSTPPSGSWWKAKNACPKGTRVATTVQKLPEGPIEIHECVGKGAWPRPKTGINRSKLRSDRGDYWVDANGKTHGAFRELLGANAEHVGFMLHGVEEGAQIDTAVAPVRSARPIAPASSTDCTCRA